MSNVGHSRICGIGLAAVALLLGSAPAHAQVDLTGEWAAIHTISEEGMYRVMPGSELGNYAGVPLNDAGRMKATSWDAAILSQPEEQAKPHPVQYSVRSGGGPNLRISKVVDPVTARLIAFTFEGFYGRADRTIWMDGRPHPSALAEHTFDGFSTGEWVGTVLKVTTTHMKMGYLQRNGIPSSPKATMVEYWTRHDNHLGVFAWYDDPVYLEEPFVRTTDWVWGSDQHVGPAVPFESVDELGNKPLGWVPHWPLGTRHDEFAKRYNLPFEGTQGGKHTIVPEYMKTIEAWRRQQQQNSAAQPQSPRR
jgi:hypothetical protein